MTNKQYIKVTKYSNKVVMTNIYEEFDFDYAYSYINEKYDKFSVGGGCTAVGKITKDDGLVIGRNMDLYITEKPSFVIRTAVPGFKRTIGLSYPTNRGEDFNAVIEHGVDSELYKVLPFLQTDVLNEDGFYIETNMRNADYGDDGKSVFVCDGTSKDNSKFRLITLMLSQYLGSRCSTVDDALKIVKEDLDLYTPASLKNGVDWNFCFLLADATGKYGVLEIAQNKIVFNEAKQLNDKEMPLGACQTNFYISKEFNTIEKMKCGVGRYDYIKSKWGSITNQSDMYKALRDVSYFQCYFDNCKFNNLSEFVGYYKEDGKVFVSNRTIRRGNENVVAWDYDYVTNPDNYEKVKEYINSCSFDIDRRKTNGSFWESIFTIVVIPAKRSIFVRFNENDDNTFSFDFSDWDKLL